MPQKTLNGEEFVSNLIGKVLFAVINAYISVFKAG